jgi:hypothetical protein
VVDAVGRGQRGVAQGQPDFLVGFAARGLHGGFGQGVGFAAGEGGLAGVWCVEWG